MKMNKKIIIVMAVVVLIGGGVYALTANKKDNTASQTNNSDTSQNPSNDQQSNSSSNTAAASTNTVSIENFAFSPPDITVKKGTTVTWTNNDSSVHTVTEVDSQTGPKSENLNNDDKYTFTFDTAGIFHYKCSIHPSMLGTVTVTE